MGRQSDEMIRQDELGYSESGDKVICAECIEDKALIEVLVENPDGDECDFCGNGHEIIGLFDAVLEQIALALSIDYCSPEEVLPLDSESETGFFGSIYDISEVLGDIDYEAPNWEVMVEIFSAFSDRQFSDKEFGIQSPNQRRFSGWIAFKKAIQHERRYSFWSLGDKYNDPDHPDYLATGDMLDEISGVVSTAGLSSTIKTGTKIWRARIGNIETPFTKDHELCPPPVESTRQPNRMSPSGISMFYGSDEYETACAEILDPERAENKAICAGQFNTTRPLKLLDLAQLPELPSYFDLEHRNEWLAGCFLRWFAKDLATPIIRDGREHIEYVPTQAFTEYVRFQMKNADGSGFDGIRYSSARTGKPCVVLFCGTQECINNPDGYGIEQWLQLDSDSVKAVLAKDVKLKIAKD